VNALVVYESLWGNTRAIAEAIAAGIGEGATAMNTADATLEKVAAAELLVAGAPILGFNLPTPAIRNSIKTNPAHAAHPADLAHPSMREWLGDLPKGSARFASFETRIWWSPGSSAKKIAQAMAELGFVQAGTPGKFLVTGTYGPLKDGELERARAWGAALATEIGR